MSTYVNNFLDNLVNGALNPKGNLGDFRHASRTFAKNTYRLAPKFKFLYHVFFDISEDGKKILPQWDIRHRAESGLLVKSAQLPSFIANIETKKKYNRVKHVQTKLDYAPVTLTFHDDNIGITTGLLEMYYRYYFADGNYGGGIKNVYSKRSVRTEETAQIGGGGSGGDKNLPGDSTYKSSGFRGNQVPFGLDNSTKDPFFNNIQISLLTRHTFTTYTLVNPIINSWNHGDVTAGANDTVENTITLDYEAVWYSRGRVVANGESPKGFGLSEHYDLTPSPNTLIGGASANFGSVLSGAVDIFDYFAGNPAPFSNPLGAIIAGANLLRSGQGLTAEGILTEGENLLTDVLENASREEILGGFSDTFFPGDD